MNKVIVALRALISTSPDEKKSKEYHALLLEGLKTAKFDLDTVKDGLDQANMMGSLNLSVLEALSKCLGEYTVNSKMAPIEALMLLDKKIDAIKLYRSTFGAYLAESKEAVEQHGLKMGIYEYDRQGYVSFKR